MPLKNPDPFSTRALQLNAKVNPYVALLRDGAESGDLPLAFGAHLEGMAGKWRERVAQYHGTEQPRRLVVEIGCHKGQTLLQLAADHPDTAFIGVDITFKRVVTTTQRAQAKGLKNVYGLLVNANAFDQVFAPGELDGCLIFFPDPWVKKKSQAKNRLLNEAFTTKLRGVLKSGGFCWVKTDQEAYFDQARAALDATGFTPATQSIGLLKDDYGSAFEARFHEQNLPTHGGKWVCYTHS